MKEVIRKEILFDLAQAIAILEQKDAKDVEELKKLSNHAIEDVALHKDLDLISITVLIYSIYKIISSISAEAENNLSRYNQNIKVLFNLVSKSNIKVKEHLQDVMQAARIKKGTVLLQKGLSIGQAAGLMGLSNWDLQQYAGRTTAIAQHHETTSVKKRLALALNLFNAK